MDQKLSPDEALERPARKVVLSNYQSPIMRTLKTLHSSIEEMDLEEQRRAQVLLARLIPPATNIDLELFRIGDIPAAWLRPARPHDGRKVILHCHGGGYVTGNLGYARIFATKLCSLAGLDVLTFEYRLAPEHPYPAQLEDVVRVWNYLMYLGYGARDVYVLGESAGGHLALTLCQRLKEQGRRLPGALVCLSPWADLTLSGPSYREREALDPMVSLDYLRSCRQAFARGMEPKDPAVSPLFGDFEGFPPTFIQVGTEEVLYSDSLALRTALQKARVPCRLEQWSGMWHVFQMFPIPKANRALTNVCQFLLDL